MLFYIAGRIDNHAILEYGFRTPFNLTDFRSAFAANYGGDYTNYYIYSVDEGDASAIRVKNGDEWSAVWDNDQIIGLDFTAQDARKWVRFYKSKDSVMTDGHDEVLVSAKVYLADKSGIDTDFNSQVDFTINSPGSRKKMRFNFSKGQASRVIDPDVSGTWTFSTDKNIGSNLRIDPDYVISFEALD